MKEEKVIVSLIIVAAGKSERFGEDKLTVKVLGKSLLAHLLHSVEQLDEIDEVILVTKEKLFDFAERILSRSQKPWKIVKGGKTRQDSVFQGLLAAKGDIVLIHDAARPILDRRLLKRLLEALTTYPAVVPVIPVTDTLRKSIGEGVLGEVVKRENLYRVQTPQGFKREILLSAYKEVGEKRAKFTDDSTLLEETLGIKTHWVKGEEKNIKITHREDIEVLESFLIKELRTGFGFDRHPLVPERPLVIGGVHIPFHKGALGHSDGDVVIHALVDAILGAAGLGNIGLLFPDTDPEYKDKKSTFFLEETIKRLKERGFSLLSADVTVLLEEPKISKFVEEMKGVLSPILEIDPDHLSIKPKRGEGLDSVGKGIAIEAYAVVNVIRGGLNDSN